MGKGYIKEVFPGGNTAYGFYSFYKYIIGDDAKRIFILKGGPGTGKSSFMKKIAYVMVDKGFDVEFHRCSSDNNSLDGVVIPQKGIALIDGTAPHVVDPVYPGSLEVIINLGQFLNEQEMQKHREAIVALSEEIKRLFSRAYKYLSAAKGLKDDAVSVMERCVDWARVNKVAYGLINSMFAGMSISDRLGKERHLFASAITPGGVKDYVETIVRPYSKRYVIKGRDGTGGTLILKTLLEQARIRGCDVEAYHCALDPEVIEHLLIPGLDVAITTWEKFEDSGLVVDLGGCVDEQKLRHYKEELEADLEYAGIMVQEAVKCINKAKKAHDELEKYYVSCMDFHAVDQLREDVLKKILRC
ncbi:PRK06851 family protein [Caldanaerobius polysaccharolyticus]|uniref:PRK06851 family protein n=1 Tax=Caldanaerobius polysaccharolyticus TaxID=44256 RepID=UPI00047965BE|nr:PRK06851 family protein [Caldanaerobius polysaccharolyticus]